MSESHSCLARYRSCRWILCYVCFVAILLLQAMRVDLSMAFVCMLKTPNHTTVYLNTTPSSINQCSRLDNNSVSDTYEGEFDWSNSLQANMLAGYFYGYSLTNVLGGILADKYGGKRVLGGSLISASILTLLYPSLSRVSGYFTLVLRIITGLVSGPMFPAAQSIWGRWTPPLESSILLGITFCGQLVGSIVGLTVSGYLCEYGFDNGWGSIFYIFGGISFLFSFVWFYVVYDTPDLHPTISEEERSYLNRTVKCKSKVKNIPWKKIMSSSAVWAIIIAHTCFNWTDNTLQLLLPLYMKEALNIDSKLNGLMSSAPWIGQAICMPIYGRLADFLRSKKYLSTRSVRVLFQTMCFIFSASLLIAVGFLKCDQTVLAGILFLFVGTTMAFYTAGFNVNHVDIAPRFAGILFGITNTFSSIPGIVTPISSKALAPNGTQEEWQIVLALCAAFSVFGAIVYAIMARGEPVDWADYGESTSTVEESLKLQEENEIAVNCKDV